MKLYFFNSDIFLSLQGEDAKADKRKTLNQHGKTIIFNRISRKMLPSILYEFLSTPAGLQEWFADKVDERDNIFSFSWNGSTDRAEVLEAEENSFIRYRWTHAASNEYFEFRIEKSEVSNQTILIIKDFAEKRDIADQTRLWDVQVHDLFHRLGN